MKTYIEAHGGEIRLSIPISRVVLENEAVKGIIAGEILHTFDKAVSTIPLPYVSRLLPDLPATLLNPFHSVNNIAVVCVIVKLKNPVTEYFWLNTNDPDMDIPGLIEYTNLRPLTQHIVYVPFYMPGEHLKFQDTNDIFIDKVRRYLLKRLYKK